MAVNTVKDLLSREQLRTLEVLCDSIIPADDRSPGALAAGAVSFILHLISENNTYRTIISGGLIWLNTFCKKHYGYVFPDCHISDRDRILTALAYRGGSSTEYSVDPGRGCFILVRKLTVDAFFTSRIGIADLGYVGNTTVESFAGCPEVSEDLFCIKSHADHGMAE